MKVNKDKVASWTGNFLMALARRRKLAAFLLLVAVAPIAAGCYGRFPLTKAVYRFNGDISRDKWIRTLIFWGFLILPVYEIAMLGDAIIFNLIEFWTGDTLDIGQTIERDGRVIALTGSEDGLTATLTVSKDGVVEAQQVFTKVSDTRFVVSDGDGRLQGFVEKQADGSLDFLDSSGMKITSVAPDEMHALKTL